MIQHKQTEVISTGPPNDTTVVWIDTNTQPPVRKKFINGEWTPVESGGGVSDYSELTGKPTINGVELDGNLSSQDLGVYTKPNTGIPASDLANGVIPDVSQFITKSVNDLTNYYLKSETYTKSEVAALIGAIYQFHYEIYNSLPQSGESNILYLIGPTGTGSDKYQEYVYSNNVFTKIGDTSIDLSGYVTTSALNTALQSYTPTSNLAPVATSGYYKDLLKTPTNVSDFTNDANYITGMTILSYGNSTWDDFLAAYNSNKVVYCRASSNANPATGTQTRLAFMAYVNNATTPTEVEFQYYRSVSSHTESQQGDEVFVYKLAKTGGWTVTTREASTKIVASGSLKSAYSNGTLTITGPTLPTNVSQLTNDANYAKYYLCQDEAEYNNIANKDSGTLYLIPES